MTHHPFSSRRSAHRAQYGITLIETTIVTSVLAVMAGLVAPSFESMTQRQHLQGAAAQLETDIQFTRSLAVAQNEPLRISFEAGAGASCYVIHSGAANQCTCDANGAPVCQGSAQAQRSVHFAANDPVSLSSNSRSVLFDPVRGTSTPTATLKLSTRNGAAIHQVVNIMGRVRSCSPAPAIGGFRTC